MSTTFKKDPQGGTIMNLSDNNRLVRDRFKDNGVSDKTTKPETIASRDYLKEHFVELQIFEYQENGQTKTGYGDPEAARKLGLNPILGKAQEM